MFFKLAWRNIWRNRRRTFITAASIGTAVFFASLLQAFQDGVYERMIENAVRFYSGYIQVHQNGYWNDKSINNLMEYSSEMEQLSNKHDNVIAQVPRLESFALASFEKNTKGVMVTGISPEAEHTLTNLKNKLVEGEYLLPTDSRILIAEGLAKYLKIGLNDTLVLISQGYRGANAAGKYAVKGIVKFPIPALNNQAVFLPLAAAQHLYAADNKLTSVVMVLNNTKQVQSTLKSLQSKVDTSAYEVMDWKMMMPELVQQMEMDAISTKITSFILFLIVGFGILGTILMMTAERSYEFGVLVAIGMKRLHLAWVTFIEIILLGLLGIVGGIALVYPLAMYFNHNPIQLQGDMALTYEKFGIEPIIPMSVEWSIFWGQGLTIFCLTAVVALYPIWVIYRLNPIKAMRS